jgi:hypothetical protein
MDRQTWLSGQALEDTAECLTTVAVLLVPLIHHVDERLERELPHLATKADLAEKPSRAYLWGVDH